MVLPSVVRPPIPNHDSSHSTTPSRHNHDPPNQHPPRLLPPRPNNGSLLILLPPAPYRHLTTTTGSVHPATHPLLPNLFSEILPTPEATLSRALELATDITKNTSTVSTKLMRDLIYRGPGLAEATHPLDPRVIHGLFRGRDNEEGVGSFLEKRASRFERTMRENAPAAHPW